MPIAHEIGYVYNETAKEIADGQKIIVHKGGTSSGKTYEIMLFTIIEVCMRFDNKVITVVSESFPHLYKGAYRIFQMIMKKEGWWERSQMNESKMIYTFPQTGTILEFASADRVAQSLGNRRFLLFVNEVNHTKKVIIDEMARRSRYFFCDFNPTAQFWLEDLLKYYGRYAIIKSNVNHNKFADPVEKANILLRCSLDPNFKRIHIDCEYGTTEGIIFDTWQSVPDFPDNCKTIIFGLDFGYTNDPTALVKVGVRGNEIYLDELIYQTKLTNQDIAGRLERLGIRRTDEIFADSAEPKSIDEIYRERWNIKPTVKGADSVVNGIQLMQTFSIFVTENSINLIRELRSYAWQVDKEGRGINKPVDIYNHAIDAARYAIQSKIPRKGGEVIGISILN